MDFKSVLLTEMRMLARTLCTILPWQNSKFYCNISPRPSSSPCYLTTDKGNIDNQDVLSQGESTTVSYSKWPFPSVGGGVTEPGYQARSAEECKKLVGVGTDGAASNIAASGLKGLVEGRLGWFFWV